MNAVKFLRHLVARGSGWRAPTRAGTGGVVAVRGFEMAVALDLSERSMRARWRERVGNKPVSYLLVADTRTVLGGLHVLGPASVDAPIHSVNAMALARAIGESAEMGALESVRHLAEEIAGLSGEGLDTEGLLSRHTFEVRFKENPVMWADTTALTAPPRPSGG